MPVLWPGAARKGSATSKNAVRWLDNYFHVHVVYAREASVVFTPEEAMGVIGELQDGVGSQLASLRDAPTLNLSVTGGLRCV